MGTIVLPDLKQVEFFDVEHGPKGRRLISLWYTKPAVRINKSGFAFNLLCGQFGWGSESFLQLLPTRKPPGYLFITHATEQERDRLTEDQRCSFLRLRPQGGKAMRVGAKTVLDCVEQYVGQISVIEQIHSESLGLPRYVAFFEQPIVENEASLSCTESLTEDLTPFRLEEESKLLIARTWDELAAMLGMSGSDPARILQRWGKKPGFPGRAGDPGKANSYFPVEEIRAFIAACKLSNDACENIDCNGQWTGRATAAKGLRITNDLLQKWMKKGCPHVPGECNTVSGRKAGRYVASEIIAWARENAPEYNDHWIKHGVPVLLP